MPVELAPFAAFDKEKLKVMSIKDAVNGFLIFPTDEGRWAISHCYPRCVLAICDTLKEVCEIIPTLPQPRKHTRVKPTKIPELTLTDLDIDL